MLTKTKTKVVTNTKLLVATVVLLFAGGSALAVAGAFKIQSQLQQPSLLVSYASDTPVSGNAVKLPQQLLAKINFSALSSNSTTVTINRVIFSFNSNSTISNWQIKDAAYQLLGTGIAYNPKVGFRLDVKIAPGTTKTLLLYADTSKFVNSSVLTIWINAASDVGLGFKTLGTFPMPLKTFTYGTPVVEKKLFVTWAADTPSGQVSPSPEQIIGKFVFSANSANASEILINSLAVEATSTFSASNWKLYKNSLGTEPLAIGQPAANSKISFSNFQQYISPGNNKIFYITANTTQAKSNNYLWMRIKSASDIGTDAKIYGTTFPLPAKTFIY